MKVGDIAPNFKLKLTIGHEIELYNLLKNGPVVLNFIMGTWCPFCDNHLKKIRDWQEKIGKNTTMLIISSESTEAMKKWNEKAGLSYLFASDFDLSVIKSYKTQSKMIKTATPSTMLVDIDHKIKILFNGVRTDKARQNMVEEICKTCIRE